MIEIACCEVDPAQTGKQYRMVGLAAPQLGIMKRVILIDPTKKTENNSDWEGFEILINPVIVEKSDKKSEVVQGCYSVPDGITGLIERCDQIVVQALDPNGKTIKKIYKGYDAHVVQHEIDHLEGIRFPERALSHHKVHRVSQSPKEIKNYRKSFKRWPHSISKEIFENLKNKNYEEL